MKCIFQCVKDNDLIGLNLHLDAGADVNLKTHNNETLLHIAALSKSFDCAMALISSGADVKSTTKHFDETPLHLAVQEGDEKITNLLLDAGADVNALNSEKEGPIFTAIRWDQQKLIELLARRGARISGTNTDGNTPLAVAANFQSPGLVKSLLDCGATREVSGVPQDTLDLLTTQTIIRTNTLEQLSKPMTANSKSRDRKKVRIAEGSDSALFDIVANNQADLLKEKFEAGANVNTVSVYSKESLLHIAALSGASECVDILLDNGANVNCQTEPFHDTPLMVSIQEGFFDIFHSLIRHGTNIESENLDGETALFTAVTHNRREMFRVLIRKGANVNKLTNGGLAPIHYATMGSTQYLLDSLLYHGADPTAGEFNPYLIAFHSGEQEIAQSLQTAAPALAASTLLPKGIFSAIRDNDCDALKRMLFHGFDLNLVDVLNGSPLHCAVDSGHMDCAKLLIEAGANVNLKTIQKQETALQIAIKRQNQEMINYLLEQGSDVTSKNYEGENCLFYSIRTKQADMVKETIKRGCQVNTFNNVGVTPLYVAISLKYNDMADILIENGADPNTEIRPSLKLAKEMEEESVAEKLSKAGAKPVASRAARSQSRLTRLNKTCGKPAADEPVEEEEKFEEGVCCVCHRNKATQKLIPCLHVVSCRGCIKQFIESHKPCPKCKLGFYATATVN